MKPIQGGQVKAEIKLIDDYRAVKDLANAEKKPD